MAIFRKHYGFLSFMMAENETPVRQLLSRDRRFVVEVLSMELITGDGVPLGSAV